MSVAASAGSPDGHRWSVTAVIPTFEAASSLAATLDALAALERPPGGTLEIIVADDGSTDGTLDVAARYPHVRVVRGERCGAAGARNRGAEAASGEILAFVDSGDLPAGPWLRQIVATFADPLVGIASWPAWLVDEARGREELARTGAGPAGMVALPTCFAMHCGVFHAVGGYDSELRCGENSDLCERAAGYCLAEGRRVARADETAARVVFGRPPAFYDRPRLDAAEHLLQRDADQLTGDRPRAVHLHAIAAVNAARCREWSRARSHSWAALRRGRSLRDLARVVVTLVPPLAARRWSTDHRRGRLGAV
jgi:glycosyltransferase involved in cell wall biosynthesis